MIRPSLTAGWRFLSNPQNNCVSYKLFRLQVILMLRQGLNNDKNIVVFVQILTALRLGTFDISPKMFSISTTWFYLCEKL